MLHDYDPPLPRHPALISPSLRDWTGPARKGADTHDCHACDGTGVLEDGEQLDVDDFRDCRCDHCDGTGLEPWRAAGERDTSAPNFDPLAKGWPTFLHWSITQPRRQSLQGRSLTKLAQAEREIAANREARERITAQPAQPFDLATYAARIFGMERAA